MGGLYIISEKKKEKYRRATGRSETVEGAHELGLSARLGQIVRKESKTRRGSFERGLPHLDDNTRRQITTAKLPNFSR
jgi:hypothetical protein